MKNNWIIIIIIITTDYSITCSFILEHCHDSAQKKFACNVYIGVYKYGRQILR